MESLYRGFPVGSLLVWETKRDKTKARGQDNVTDTVKMLLDGQQRMTSLYGIIRGSAPRFFDGDPKAFTDLYFNVKEQTFEFYGPMKMADNPYWISVTELMKKGPIPFLTKFANIPEISDQAEVFVTRLNTIHQIQEVDLHIEEVTGEDKDTDTVVDIFNRVNSGGTKLSKGDLALAKICGSWPEARTELKQRLKKWQDAGFDFKMEWFLRCINSVVTGEAMFHALDNVTTSEFSEGMETAEKAIDRILNTIASRLGLDHNRVLGSVYSFPLMCRYVATNNMTLGSHTDRDRLLFWYIHSMLWGRYAGSTESVLDKDLGLLEEDGDSIDNLIHELRQNRGDLKLYPSDFRGWSRGTRFYPMLYMLTRVSDTKDWETGDRLKHHLLGNFSRLQLHHIFPKNYLYNSEYERSEVNALANMTFLTQEANLKISDRPPLEYFPEIESKHPGALRSHWIPMDEQLWHKERFKDFLAARQELLAEAANDFLESLRFGKPEPAIPEDQEEVAEMDELLSSRIHISDAEDQTIRDLKEWMANQHLSEGETDYELDDEHENPIAVLNLAWPDGIQEGFSQPVALILDDSLDEKTMKQIHKRGFRYFVSVDEFKEYVLQEVLVEH